MGFHSQILVSCLTALCALDGVASAQLAKASRQSTLFDCNKARRDEVSCLACNIYFEARGESMREQAKVASVTMRRLVSPTYPRTLCGVVWQPYQFSWTDDGKSDKVYDGNAWARALFLAGTMVSDHRLGSKIKSYVDTGKGMNEVLWYHSKKVKPKWSRKMRRHSSEGGHIFYRKR
ncbi:cell wall hydrolase [Nitrosomonas sp. Nm132]|uniref:cell wall hydrolase n=1 Tax=Nitrosomonas sp. Nm132 TaxID=1881053 RepID=UPI0008902730|nr:Cell Wall Hydrolase [Nitrosomonas sp. Nm132]